MPIDWSKHTLAGLVQILGPAQTSFVPEFETVALYQALRAFNWPGEYVEHAYHDTIRPSRAQWGQCRCVFLSWGEERQNAKGETPLDVIDGRYPSLMCWEDLDQETVVPDDDAELHPIAALMDLYLLRLRELEALENTPYPAGHHALARL